ncbi:MAG: hypothetical protein K2Q07_10870 [Burkholderiaceae bacterium]|nr:hypothetical protein [Burkholderiaceae bacterium]
MSDTLLTLDAPAVSAAASASGTAASPKKTKVVKAAPVKKPATAARKTAPSPAPAAAGPAAKPPKTKHKLVRDSFTMPHSDFELIDVLKQRAMSFHHAVKKSELLRAGLQVLAALPDVQLEKALARITPLKTGRPKKAG